MKKLFMFVFALALAMTCAHAEEAPDYIVQIVSADAVAVSVSEVGPVIVAAEAGQPCEFEIQWFEPDETGNIPENAEPVAVMPMIADEEGTLTVPDEFEPDEALILLLEQYADTDPELIPEDGHIWLDGSFVSDADCETVGVYMEPCEGCEAVRLTAELGNHSYGSFVTTKEPTCTKEGSEKATCTICGEECVRSIEADGHSYGSYKIIEEPTCTETGLKKATCSVCGKKKKKEIPATGHDFGEWFCDEELDCCCRICEICDEEEYEDHEYDFTDDGESGHTIFCERCDYSETEAHNYSDYETAKVGHRQVCGICGHPKTEEYEAHDFEYLSDEDGHWQRCKICGYEDMSDYTAHSYSSFTDNGDGTCTGECVCGKTLTEEHTYGSYADASDGEHCQKRVCTRCGSEEYTTHDIVDMADKAPTCTEDGSTGGRKCSVCGTVTTEPTTVSKTGHQSNGEYSYDIDYHWNICNKCGAKFNVAEHFMEDSDQCYCGYIKE